MAGTRLLVADDSLTIQKVIRLALSQDEYEIQTVSDGQDAIQQISLFKPSVVLIDITLPGKNAFEVKSLINEQMDSNAARFVLLSSAFEQIDEARVQEVGFHGRLTKPFDPAQLRTTLNQVLAEAPTKEIFLTEEIKKNAVEMKAGQNMREMSKEVAVQLDEHWDKEDPFPDLSPPPLTPEVLNDEFQWNINESRNDDSSLFTKKDEEMEFLRNREPAILPPPKLFEMDSEFKIPSLSAASMPFTSPPPPPSAENSLSTHDDLNVLPVTTAQMEGLLKKQLTENLEKMLQKMLPEIAERVVKQEIHKMLEEKP